jgi:type IV secretion system protein VirB6
MALNVSSFLLTLSTVGLLIVSRILLALLLAITPVMAGFLLFDATRGLLEGWLRTLTAAALVPLFVLILCAIELAMLNPLLDRMLADQAGGRFELDTVTPVARVVILFSIAIVASSRAAATIARGIRLPPKAYDGVAAPAPTSTTVMTETTPMSTGTRAAAASPIARALESAARRDAETAGNRTRVMMRGSRDVAVSATTIASTAGGNDKILAAGMRPTSAAASRLPRASRAAARRDL